MALDAQRNWNVAMADSLPLIRGRPKQPSPPRSGPQAHEATSDRCANAGSALPAAHLPPELLILILDRIADRGEHPLSAQRDFHACALVSWDWNAAATPFLYSNPWLQGPNYDLFTRTICPSINLAIRKSPLASFVRELDLTKLVHQGSKSVTARLLGRTKNNLERFAAPQASFSLNCFPALSKCRALRSLDLSLVSEATSLKTLFDAVAGLLHLRELQLPRSAGFGASVDPATIDWPPGLVRLGLSGGLDGAFWRGTFHFPDTISEIRLTHCPKLDDFSLQSFLHTLGERRPASLHRMTFSNLPRLEPEALNTVLFYLPRLTSLSVSVDYVTPEVLNPFAVGYHKLPTGRLDVELYEGSVVHLRNLELTDSGDVGDLDKFRPMDLLIYASDYRTLPRLVRVSAQRTLGWFSEEEEDDLNELDDWLVENAAQLGLSGDRSQVGVKIWNRTGDVQPIL